MWESLVIADDLGSSLSSSPKGLLETSVPSSLSSSDWKGFKGVFFASSTSSADSLLSSCFSCCFTSAFNLRELDFAELSGGGFEGRSGKNGFKLEEAL